MPNYLLRWWLSRWFLGTVVFLALHGMKDASLLVVLATAGAQVAYGIAGVKPSPPSPSPGTTSITATSVPSPPASSIESLIPPQGP